MHVCVYVLEIAFPFAYRSSYVRLCIRLYLWIFTSFVRLYVSNFERTLVYLCLEVIFAFECMYVLTFMQDLFCTYFLGCVLAVIVCPIFLSLFHYFFFFFQGNRRDYPALLVAEWLFPYSVHREEVLRFKLINTKLSQTDIPKLISTHEKSCVLCSMCCFLMSGIQFCFQTADEISIPSRTYQKRYGQTL